MLRSKLVRVSKLRDHTTLFPIEKTEIKRCPPLVDKNYNILSGYEIISSSDKIWVMVLKDPGTNLKVILEYQEDLKNRKLNLYERLTFLRNSEKLFRSASKDKILEVLNLPKQKTDLYEYFKNIQEKDFQDLFMRGIFTLREAEYFYKISKTGFHKLLLESSIMGKSFRLALNMAFELYQLGRLNNFNTVKATEIEDFLMSLRYPTFYSYLSDYEKYLSQIKKPHFIKIFSNPFFEGKKINIHIELKNLQQCDEIFTFFNKEKNKIRGIFQYI